jgi:hypothetical protein
MNNACSHLYQDRDQEFYTAIITGESAADFNNAIYEVFERYKREPIFTKTLGNGITVEDTEFKTMISKEDVPKAGEYYHQFTVTNQLNQELPPIFSGAVKIKEVR